MTEIVINGTLYTQHGTQLTRSRQPAGTNSGRVTQTQIRRAKKMTRDLKKRMIIFENDLTELYQNTVVELRYPGFVSLHNELTKLEKWLKSLNNPQSAQKKSNSKYEQLSFLQE